MRRWRTKLPALALLLAVKAAHGQVAEGSWLGCYEVKFGGRPQSHEIRARPNGGLSMYPLPRPAGSESDFVPMKRATPDEVEAVRQQLPLNIRDGITMEWPRDTPNQTVIGFFHASEKSGRKLILALVTQVGEARKIPCP